MSSEELKTQSLLMNIYSFIFARKIGEELADVAKGNFYGCQIDHPSQTHHSCLMLSEIEHLYSYYQEATGKVNTRDLFCLWKQEVKICDLSEETKNNFCVLLESNDFREKNCPSSNKLRSMVERLIFIRRSFYIGRTIIYDCI
jgi:hypothetical protein